MYIIYVLPTTIVTKIYYYYYGTEKLLLIIITTTIIIPVCVKAKKMYVCRLAVLD